MFNNVSSLSSSSHIVSTLKPLSCAFLILYSSFSQMSFTFLNVLFGTVLFFSQLIKYHQHLILLFFYNIVNQVARQDYFL